MKILGWIWALPTTLIGFALFLLSGASPYRLRPAGVVQWVACRGPWAWYFAVSGMAAITIGAMTCFAVGYEEDAVRLRHERQHTYQAFVLGALFIPVYYACCLYALARGRPAYMGNPLEVQAYAIQGEVDK